jgi:hypothetical protein
MSAKTDWQPPNESEILNMSVVQCSECCVYGIRMEMTEHPDHYASGEFDSRPLICDECYRLACDFCFHHPSDRDDVAPA